MTPLHRVLPPLAFAALLALPPGALAAPGRAGLWEVSTTLNFGIGGLQVDAAQAEQLRQMGLALPGLGKPYVARQCITPEQAAANGLPWPQTGDSGCALRNVRGSGAVWNADIACSGTLQGQGTMVARFDGPERFSGHWTFRGSSAEVPTEVEMSNPFSGRWLGPDCGRRTR